MAAAYVVTALLVGRQVLPEFRARYWSRVWLFVPAYALLWWRTGASDAAVIAGSVLACGVIATLGRPQLAFPRRWFHPTGSDVVWLRGWQVALFSLLLASVLALAFATGAIGPG